MMNPLAYLLAALAIFAAGFGSGFHVGKNEQKVADQAQFDETNQKLTDQKTLTNTEYRKKQDENLALMAERDQLKTNLEKQSEQNRAATAALRDKYAPVGLRFSAAKAPGLGNSGQCAGSAGTDPASAGATAVVQLPDSLASNLRRLAFDADTLADEYRKCYGYANQVK